MKIYLAGKIAKDESQSGQVDWRKQFMDLSQESDLQILTPEDSSLDEGLPWVIVGHDALQISRADVVVIDARDKIGAGTAQEMLIAKYFAKPVLTILPKGSHHRRQNVTLNGQAVAEWIHPFIAVSSDMIVDSIEEMTQRLADKSWQLHPLSIDLVERAIEEYLTWLDR